MRMTWLVNDKGCLWFNPLTLRTVEDNNQPVLDNKLDSQAGHIHPAILGPSGSLVDVLVFPLIVLKTTSVLRAIVGNVLLRI